MPVSQHRAFGIILNRLSDSSCVPKKIAKGQNARQKALALALKSVVRKHKHAQSETKSGKVGMKSAKPAQLGG